MLPSTGPSPWAAAEWSFAGWVPNVSGHLSFNRIPARDTLPAYNHQSASGRRTVMVHRERIAQDYPYFDWIVRRFAPSARQDFVLVARSCTVTTPHFAGAGDLHEYADANGALVGTVTVFPSDGGTNRRPLANYTRLLDRRIAAAIENRVVNAPEADELALAVGLTARPPGASYQVSVALFRTGELRLWFDTASLLGRDIAAEPVTELELKVIDLLPAQVYYFVKDLLHAHYHHDAHQDQALPFVRVDTKATDAGWLRSETSWRYATLRGLVRLVIELRQGRSFLGHKKALGIIAYAQAFQRTLVRITRPIDADAKHLPHDELMPYAFDDLKLSIESANSAAESSNASLQQFFAIMVLILLSALTLWTGSVQIQPTLCNSLPTDHSCPPVGSGPVVDAINWIVANPHLFVLVLLATGLVAFLRLFSGTGALRHIERFLRWNRTFGLALAAQISRWLAKRDRVAHAVVVALFIGSSLGFGALAYRLVPRQRVPRIETTSGRANRTSRWADIYAAAGRPVEESGILVRGSIAPQLRSMLGPDYPIFVRSFKATSSVQTDGDRLVASSGPRPGGDGAYLIVDPTTARIEAGLRLDGSLTVHRSGGAALPRPPVVPGFGNMLQSADIGPVPLESTSCDAKLSDTGRTLQLSGVLRVGEFCESSVDLRKDQTIRFDPVHANGLDVIAMGDGTARTIRPYFQAKRDGRLTLRVVWLGTQKADTIPRPRPFYVRLEMR